MCLSRRRAGVLRFPLERPVDPRRDRHRDRLCSERLDNDLIHDNAKNNSRLTCKSPGVYQVTAAGAFANSATGIRQAMIG
jgi:hypothetical protein